MADVISRLKLDSGEFDSKIKRAGQELMAYSEHCKKMGLEMGYANKDAKDFAKALGSMQTTSSSARGKINELTEAFVNLKVMYKNMTDEEKNNAFGKNLAASLDQLKTRIDQAKAELNDVNKELGNTKQAEIDTKGGLEGLTSALGINIKTLAGWGTAIAAGKVALDVAKDAFLSSESNVDEWGRTMAASQSLYEGFLTALNTGDINGYLSRIDEIVSAARTAYNELDRLGTMKTIQAPKVSAQQTENERIRSMIQTGRYIAPVDGRRNAVFNGREMQNGDKLTAGQIRALEKQLQNGMQNVVKLVGNEVKQTGKAIDAVYERQAKELGISLKEFRKGTSSMEEFDKRMAGYDKYQQWREQHTTIDQKSGRETVARGNPYAEYGKWGTFRVDGDRYNQLVQLIQQRNQQAAQAYGMQSQAYRTMNRAEGFTVSKILNPHGNSGNSSGTTPQEQAQKQVEAALLTYQQTIDKANMEMESGLKTEADVKKTTLSAQERLYDAYGKAYATYADPKYKEAQDAAAAEILKLGGEVKRMEDAVKASKIKWDIGASGFNDATMSAWMQGRQGDLQKAEFGSADYSAIQANIADMNAVKTVLEQSVKAGIDAAQFDLEPLWEKIFDGENIDDTVWQGMVDVINEKLQELHLDPIKLDFQTGNIKKESKEMAKDWQAAGNAIQAVGQAMNAIEDPAAKVLGTIAQAVATMALSYAQAAASPAVTGTGWGWIAFAATGLATMLSSVAAIKQATSGFAGGGVIPGNSLSGDNLRGITPDGSVYGLNAGEVILNRAQANNLANDLSSSDRQGTKSQPYVTGETVWLGLNNYLRAAGYGEIVTTNRR